MTKQNFKRGDIVKIEWIDSCSDARVWVYENEFDFDSHDKAMYYKSIGYFIKKTSLATYICESMRIHEDEGESNLAHVFSIPNRAIISIKKITNV